MTVTNCTFIDKQRTLKVSGLIGLQSIKNADKNGFMERLDLSGSKFTLGFCVDLMFIPRRYLHNIKILGLCCCSIDQKGLDKLAVS